MKRFFFVPTIAIMLTFTLAVAPAITHAKALAEPISEKLETKAVEPLIVLPTDTYDREEANAMIDRIALIPAPMLDKLYARKVKIKLVNGKITDEPEFAKYKGVVPRGWEKTGLTWDDVPGVSTNVVIIKIGHSDPGHGHNSHNLELHETLHAIDRYVLNNISATPEFYALWKAEANIKYKNDGYVSVYPAEYFAEAATLYLISAETRTELKNTMPKTYHFFDYLFNTFETE